MNKEIKINVRLEKMGPDKIIDNINDIIKDKMLKQEYQ